MSEKIKSRIWYLKRGSNFYHKKQHKNKDGTRNNSIYGFSLINNSLENSNMVETFNQKEYQIIHKFSQQKSKNKLQPKIYRLLKKIHMIKNCNKKEIEEKQKMNISKNPFRNQILTNTIKQQPIYQKEKRQNKKNYNNWVGNQCQNSKYKKTSFSIPKKYHYHRQNSKQNNIEVLNVTASKNLYYKKLNQYSYP